MIFAGASALAAEAPEWQLSGNMNFQAYWVEQDYNTAFLVSSGTTSGGDPVSHIWVEALIDPVSPGIQDHSWYFGVDEAELALSVWGTADNGLGYGLKVEIQANTTDDTMDKLSARSLAIVGTVAVALVR